MFKFVLASKFLPGHIARSVVHSVGHDEVLGSGVQTVPFRWKLFTFTIDARQ